MIKLYLKQAWQLLRQNRLITSISIAGTALSVAAVMLVVLIYQVNYANYAPENNRYRMLYVTSMSARSADDSGKNNGQMSLRVLRECLYSLQTPQAVTGIAKAKQFINKPGERLSTSCTVLFTDQSFWRIFDFHFISGGPFTTTDMEAKLRQVVVSATMARKLFGTADAVGATFRMNHLNYKVRGVVDDVSRSAQVAYADVWIPYTVNTELMSGSRSYENTTGPFSAYLLATSSSDFTSIRKELQEKVNRFNGSLAETEIDFMYSPYTQWERIIGANGFSEPKLQQWLLNTGGMLLFLLLLPALNTIGITLTQFRKRRSEIGIRKSFGAHSGILVMQVLTENLLISCIGGAIGLIFSYVLLYLCRSILFTTMPHFSFDMLLQPVTFLLAFLFILILNLLSAGWPAYKASRMPIVQALNDLE